MKKYLIPLIVDLGFLLFVTFTLSLIFTSYFLPYPKNLIVAICLALLIFLLEFKLLKSKSDKRLSKSVKKTQLERLKEHLSMLKKSEALDIFYAVFKKKGFSVDRKKGGLYIKEKSALILTCFEFLELDKTFIVKAFNKLNKSDTAFILATDCKKEILDFAKRFNGRISIVLTLDIYEFLEKNSALPHLQEVKATPKIKVVLKGFFTKKRALKFFFLGLTFLILSVFAFYKYYYVILGSILMIIGIVSRLFGLAETSTSPKKLPD